MIHSAEWPDAIKNQFLADELKSSYTELLRICDTAYLTWIGLYIVLGIH